MRINKFLAQATGLSRRAADQAIEGGAVFINSQPAIIGQEVSGTDEVTFQGRRLQTVSYQLVMLHKPAGYVVSRDGQGGRTIYGLLPPEYQNLKPVGRLDKDSSGLLLLTNDGQLAYELTHPKFAKQKIYEIELDKPLTPEDKNHVAQGVMLDDGKSKLLLEGTSKNWTVRMSEGRNRQIRRTFAALDYTVTKLHRTHFGEYDLADLPNGKFQKL